MGKGDVQWRWDIQAGWTRNLTVGGGWDAAKLMAMFRRLFAARSEYEMNEIMIEIANSRDFRALLYQLGFVPEATNGLQILRILISGHGSSLIQSILKQLGNAKGSADIRRLLFSLLQIEEMSNWIKDHTGKHHPHAFKNWRKFINSLQMPTDRWNRGQLWKMGWDVDIHGGSMDSRAKLIADLWRTFVRENGMDTAQWQQLLKFTFTDDSHNHGVNGYINVDLMDEIYKLLNTDTAVKNRWDDFLNRRNITVSWYHGPDGRPGGRVGTNVIYEWLKWLSGHGNGIIDQGSGGLKENAGFTKNGIKNVADLWRMFVTEMQLDKDGSLADVLRWTFTPDNHIHNAHNNRLLVNEMKNILANDDLRHKWMQHLKNRNVNIISTSSGWDLVNGGTRDDLASWFYWLFTTVGNDVNGNNGGLTDNGIRQIADIWRTFITDMHLDRDGSMQHLLQWTLSGNGLNDANSKQMFINELMAVLQDDNIRNGWLRYLQTHGINVVATNNGWDVVKGGGGQTDVNSWLTWLYTTQGSGNNGFDWWNSNGSQNGWGWWNWFMNNGMGVHTAGFTNQGIKAISNLWRQFIAQLNLDQTVWRDTLKWTNNPNAQNSKNGYLLLLEEMRAVLRIDIYLRKWVEFLSAKKMSLVFDYNSGLWNVVQGGQNGDIRMWIYWLFMTQYTTPPTSTGGSGDTQLFMGYSHQSISILSELWRQFIAELNLDLQLFGDTLLWSSSNDKSLSVQDRFLLLLEEMRLLLRETAVRSAWAEFLQARGYAIINEGGVWYIVNGSHLSHFDHWVLWLYGSAFKSNLARNDNLNTFYTKNGYSILVELWRQFIFRLDLDVSTWGHALKWTLNSNTNINYNQQIWLLLQEMRAILSNKEFLDCWIDFMHERNYIIVYSRGGWDIIQGGSSNNVALWIYWLFVTVDELGNSDGGHFVFNHNGGLKSALLSIQHFMWNQIISVRYRNNTEIWNRYFVTIQSKCRKYKELLVQIKLHHRLAHLHERQQACVPYCEYFHISMHDRNYVTDPFNCTSFFRSFTSLHENMKNITINTRRNTSPTIHLKTSSYCSNNKTVFSYDYIGAYTLNGFRFLQILWEKFVKMLLATKCIRRQNLKWTYCNNSEFTDREKYVILQDEIQSFLRKNEIAQKFYLFLKSTRFKFEFNYGAWDLTRGIGDGDFHIWLMWILAPIHGNEGLKEWNSYHGTTFKRRSRRDTNGISSFVVE